MTADSAPAAKPRKMPAALLLSICVAVVSVMVAVNVNDIRSLQVRVSETESRLSFLTYHVMVLSAQVSPPPPPRGMLHTRLFAPRACRSQLFPAIEVDAP